MGLAGVEEPSDGEIIWGRFAEQALTRVVVVGGKGS